MMQTEQYVHHGKLVHVVSALKGKHREMCLCFSCQKFQPDGGTKCPIAHAVYENCVKHNLVTPVIECPEYAA